MVGGRVEVVFTKSKRILPSVDGGEIYSFLWTPKSIIVIRHVNDESESVDNPLGIKTHNKSALSSLPGPLSDLPSPYLFLRPRLPNPPTTPPPARRHRREILPQPHPHFHLGPTTTTTNPYYSLNLLRRLRSRFLPLCCGLHHLQRLPRILWQARQARFISLLHSSLFLSALDYHSCLSTPCICPCCPFRLLLVSACQTPS